MLLSVFCLTVLAVLAESGKSKPGEAKSSESETLGWTYGSSELTCAGTEEDSCGPKRWGKVASDCDGKRQSPINFGRDTVTSMCKAEPDFEIEKGGCDKWEHFSTTSTLEVAFEGCRLAASYEEASYELLHMHFHSPSEHTVGSGYYEGEVHLVHKNALTGNLLVVGVFLQVSAGHTNNSGNAFLKNIWDFNPEEEGSVRSFRPKSRPKLNPYYSLLPGSPAHFSYLGSLTTPPCSEIVQWVVYATPVTISAQDLALLRSAFAALPTNILSEGGNNNRLTASTEGRDVNYVPGGGCDVMGLSTATLVLAKTTAGDSSGSADIALGSVMLASVALALCVGIAGYILRCDKRLGAMLPEWNRSEGSRPASVLIGGVGFGDAAGGAGVGVWEDTASIEMERYETKSALPAPEPFSPHGALSSSMSDDTFYMNQSVGSYHQESDFAGSYRHADWSLQNVSLDM
ncbi:alpha carbonic anhydrase [Ochromonadaceae sp. CCMP2298]|nr:alpha carbonic anhydrase [Ochromonadaceae sp. CCMP2298]